MGEFAFTCAHHVEDAKTRARAQDARDLNEQRALVGNVHSNMQHVGGAERSVRERERQSVALLQRYAFAQMQPAR